MVLPLTVSFTVHSDLQACAFNKSTTSASGTRSGILAQDTRTVLAQTEESLRVWRRQEMVRCPRENTLSVSIDVAMIQVSDPYRIRRGDCLTRNREVVKSHLGE